MARIANELGAKDERARSQQRTLSGHLYTALAPMAIQTHHHFYVVGTQWGSPSRYLTQVDRSPWHL